MPPVAPTSPSSPSSSEARARLAAELESAALRALSQSYYDINETYFRGLLRPATLELSDSATRLGRWVPAVRVIEIARDGLTRHGWGALVEVLKHEMAHQFVDEVMGVRDEGPHGPAFRAVCEKHGFDARAAGVPEAGGGAAAGERARVLERVAKLLALAQSPDLHEAQSAMNAAQRLMLKHNLEAVTAGNPRGYTFRHLGEPAGRVDEAARILANIIGDHFFVEAIWVPVWRPAEARKGFVLEVCGALENVEMAEYVHSFLRHTAEGLWRAHKAKQGVRGDRDRRAYVAGVMAGFRDKLAAQRKGDDARGLVWVGDANLTGFFRKRHPRVRTVYRTSSERSEAHARGREAGRNIVLHRGVGAGAAGGAGGGAKQLGPGRG